MPVQKGFGFYENLSEILTNNGHIGRESIFL